MSYKESNKASTGADLRVRPAREADAVALRRLEQLAESPPLAGEVLLAEVDGELVAACSLADGRAIGDPFRHTRAVRELLVLRARQLAGTAAGGGRTRARRWRLAHRTL
jgi:hypothetical protein